MPSSERAIERLKDLLTLYRRGNGNFLEQTSKTGTSWSKSLNGNFPEEISRGELLENAKDIKGVRASFNGAHLSSACFDGADLDGATFVGAKCGPDVIGENTKYSGQATLSAARFCNASLCNADFSDADLQGVDFSGADIRGAIFSRAKMQNTIALLSNERDTNIEKGLNGLSTE